jgi:predicted nucleic acid-binding protein
LPLRLPDADDEPFLEVAVAGGTDALVTGNAKHFRPKGGRLAMAVVSPSAFLRMLAEG